MIKPAAAQTVEATVPPPAAQTNDSAAALSLFEEGRRLVKVGDYALACPKFELAAKIHPSAGVLLNLADCYERTNRTASAWVDFDEAASTAARMGLQREQAEAVRRKGSLEPRLRRLLIHVESAAEGLTVQRDGELVDRAAWGAAIPVDPGEHRIVVEEPDRITWEITAATGEEGGVVVVDVPELQHQPVEKSTTEAALPPPAQGAIGFQWTPWRVRGAASTGAGLVAMAIGGSLLWAAKVEFDDAEHEAGPARVNDSSRAVTESYVATGLVIGGAVVAVAGFVLWLANPGGGRAATQAKSSPAWRLE